MNVELYDTTLRDGAQGPGISFTIDDKLRIMQALDDFGIHYIEAGNPGSNPKDMEVFIEAKKLSLKTSKLCAFGSTCRAGTKAHEDKSLIETVKAGTDAVAIFGKSWLLHIEKVIRTTAEENMRIICDSIKFLKDNVREVIFDAEHFFDGYKDTPEYALEILYRAKKAGADCIVLCDTNGGTMSDEIGKITNIVQREIGGRIGIHCHNDNGLSVASSISAVKNGAVQIQGTINGLGERCGNTNLCVIIPNLQLKLGYNCVSAENLKNLGFLGRYVAEIANEAFPENMPYVGGHAFTHKGGMHIDAVNKIPASFEHISPELVGNERTTLISEVAGRAALMNTMSRLVPDITKDSIELKNALSIIKDYENDGYQYENAEGSLMLLLLEATGKRKSFFTVETFKLVLSEPHNDMQNTTESAKSAALIKVKVDNEEEITAAEGDGPVNALDKALRKALIRFYPQLSDMKLVDYKVRVLNSTAATASKVRVIIESSDTLRTWRTVGVSTDIIDASWKALLDSLEYKLSIDSLLFLREKEKEN